MGEEGNGHDASGATAVEGEDAKTFLAGLAGFPLVVACKEGGREGGRGGGKAEESILDASCARGKEGGREGGRERGTYRRR
jgi:hypothetical protein